MNKFIRCQDTRLPLQERCVGGCCGAQLTAAVTILESVSSFLARLRLQPSCSRHAASCSRHAAVMQCCMLQWARLLGSWTLGIVTSSQL